MKRRTQPSTAQRLALSLIACVVTMSCLSIDVQAEYQIGAICRVKGQESNSLRGVGLVVGLNGTGDPDLVQTRQALARMLVNSGMELPVDNFGREDISDFMDVTNIALVIVTAEIPETGSRQGSKVKCQVHAFGSAKSIDGGFLVDTALTGGPATGQSGTLPVLAHAKGRIASLDGDKLTTGVIEDGCQLDVELTNDYFYFDVPWGVRMNRQPTDEERTQMYIDLVIDRSHASFFTASRVAHAIDQNSKSVGVEDQTTGISDAILAKAIDPTTVQVRVPEHYYSDPVEFIEQILSFGLIDQDGANSNVVINPRMGTVIIGEDVYFSPCVISSGDFTIDTGNFVPLNLEDNAPVEGGPQQKLRDLHNALKALQAPPATIIDIIQKLDAAGYLKGKIISEE